MNTSISKIVKSGSGWMLVHGLGMVGGVPEDFVGSSDQDVAFSFRVWSKKDVAGHYVIKFYWVSWL